jgi:hypothetical protein
VTTGDPPLTWWQAAAEDAFKHLNSIDDRKMAVSRQSGLVLYAGSADVWAYVAQLEHVITFLSKHADGILKNQVQKFQDKLIELRASSLYMRPRDLLTACAAWHSL